FSVGIAAAAFIAIFFFEVPFPAIVVGAGILGWLGRRFLPVPSPPGTPASSSEAEPVVDVLATQIRPSLGRSLRVLAVCLTLWFVPLLAVRAALGPDHVLAVQGEFFSKMAVVTFGGAYAVLAYVAQQAVETYRWLGPGEMLDGLGMAETTPGPLIMVLQFVGFMGAWRHPGGLDPLMAGILGSVLTTWVTFVPCFLWIFLGAPYVETLRNRKALSAALAGITAAVVGVILNLAVWFSLHTLFGEVAEVHRFGVRLLVPAWETLDPAALVLAAGAFLALFKFKRGMLETLALSAAAGLVYYLLSGR
ncbi:MAG TPA: chromate transporter, partial [Thermoanaerobaculia bacterium]|nr:chromate transporter [Thermoanaerobaculia bacterium]